MSQNNLTDQTNSQSEFVNLGSTISRILLINTPRLTIDQLKANERSSDYFEVYPPLGLMYLCASVNKYDATIETRILDLHLDSIKYSQQNRDVDWIRMCDDVITSYRPDMVGLSIMFGASFESAQSIGISIKGKFPNLVIVCGGVHVTGLVKEHGTDLDFSDFVCINESENHFISLIKYLNHEPVQVRGVVARSPKYIRNKSDFCNDIDTFDEVDEIPIPDFSAVPLGDYYKFGILSAAQTVSYDTPLATMQTVRGCTARCTFCSVRNFNGFGIR